MATVARAPEVRARPARRPATLAGSVHHPDGDAAPRNDACVAGEGLRHEITRHGEVLHSDGSEAVEQCLDFALRDYVRLNEERAGILQDIRERGRVHGR